jgi:polyisoprenyl-phosphate glycosyltransferase
MSGVDLSIVIPVYKNAETLEDLFARTRTVLDGRKISFEIIFVNDACPQDSLAVLRRLADCDTRVAVVSMARNVGQQNAVLAGLREAAGRRVAIMDADLQDPPEALPGLFDRLDEGYDVVFAGRRGRYEDPGRLLTSRLYKWVLHVLTGVPADAGLFLLADTKILGALLEMPTDSPHLVAMIGAIGVRCLSIPVERSIRPAGASTYTSWMRFKMGMWAALWALGWRMGISGVTRRERPSTPFPIGERLGAKFLKKPQESK